LFSPITVAVLTGAERAKCARSILWNFETAWFPEQISAFRRRGGPVLPEATLE
jgi:hypothetical protein